MDRQKILMIFGGALLAAVVVTALLYKVTQAPKQEATVAVLAATRDMPAGTRLQKGDVHAIRVLAQDAPKGAVVDEKQLIDRPLLFPVGANEPITPFKVSSPGGSEGLPSTIEIGKRAIAVQVNDPSGVAGLIQPRAHVDVLFTRAGSMAEAVTSTILEDVVVLAIGRVTEVATAQTAATGAATQVAAPQQGNQNRAATLLVTPEQARVLELAKNQGRISLALRNPLDHGGSADPHATTSDALYGNLPKELRPDLRNRNPQPVQPQVRVVAPPKPPEPEEKPKPKNVVEVFRGDRHTQEKF